MIDVYDYPGSLGTRRIEPHEARFETARMTVLMLESHHYQKKSRMWTMRQQFEVEDAGEVSTFEVVHRLRVRTMREYARALAAVGFTVLQALTAYPTGSGRTPAGPHTPEALRHDRRLILVARR